MISRGGAALIAVVGLACVPARGQVVPPFDDPDQRMEQLDPGPSLPQSANGVTRRGEDEKRVTRVDTIRDVFRALRACWQPVGLRATGQEITVQFAFKRNGEILGQPKITYYKPGGQEDDREAFTRSVREAFVRCAPLPFTETFGGAVAGRLFTFRFIDAVPL
jgi:hypothetical protein